MKRVVRLTESDLARIVRQVIKEDTNMQAEAEIDNCDENDDSAMERCVDNLFADMTEDEAENYIIGLSKRKPRWLRKLIQWFKRTGKKIKREVKRSKKTDKIKSGGALVTFAVLAHLFLKHAGDVLGNHPLSPFKGVNETDIRRIVRLVISEQPIGMPNPSTVGFPKKDDEPSEKNKKFNDYLFKLNELLVYKINKSFRDIFQTENFSFKPYYNGQDLGIQIIKRNKKEIINLVRMGDAKNACQIMQNYFKSCKKLGMEYGKLYDELQYMDNLYFNRTVRTNQSINTRRSDKRDAKRQQFEDEVKIIVDEVVGDNVKDCSKF